MDDQEVKNVADVFRIFGDPTRVRILGLLMEGEFSVSDIAERMDMTQSTVSHQLRILRDSRLVRSRRDGKQIFYALDDDHVRTILFMGLEHVREAESGK
ncbi:MAG: metalloregulator ArsR/SmtB family transcription factor [Lachnospiraceae bacterium]|jgi:ArsR family transcriptional regulator|nr:metalloregulator ArsR/SmtB family transcription factor [Lachnospiraceae bacterium]MCH4031929.1 metalloregulator ArsR/SmtB family transcription factor [Lachnospiraceae bacterium]MCH4070552.1 metalloregulator ArsR/SmtB family transcription factor [Lachnospiraceae bacterium]MCH4109220.1 metalloregulator ArsR/SmtB family transcription factor [Lachnospiraceae bacterium]MCI1303229.1 metalloregulator ArsR/SmtB family transcription factor [Lachnospiraceae bacterium]